MNRVAEDLTGMSDAESRALSLGDLVWRNPMPFDDTDLAQAVAARAGEGETTIHARGSPRPVSYRVVPIGEGRSEDNCVVELIDLTGETGTAGALRRSETRLRMAAEATGIGVWDVNPRTGERQWSKEFTDILGLPPGAKPDDRLFASLIHEDDRDRVDRAYDRAYREESASEFSAEFRIRRADDGEERWVAVSGRVMFDRNGVAIRGIGTLRDIHQRRLAEVSIRESEERLRVALVAGRMGTWRTNLVTGAQQWDLTQCELMGVDPTVVPTRELFLSLVHPEDVSAVPIDLDTLPGPGIFIDSEYRIVRPDGSIRWIVANAMVRYDSEGRPIEMIGVNRDITQEKEAALQLQLSEERLRLAVEANDIGTWDYDLTTGEHQWSVAFLRLWGLPDDAPADPALLRPLASESDWKMIRAAWQEASDPEGDGRIALEYLVHGADGEARWCAFAGRMFFDDKHENVVRALGIGMNVTERKATETRQRLILREMNHRVKNNLAIIQAIISQTLRTTPDTNTAFERIQSRLDSLARTHDFLNNDQWLGIRLGKLMRQALDPFLGDAPERLVIEGPSVALDSSATLALGLIFHELGANALKHGAWSVPKGRVMVNWSVTGDDTAHRHLFLNWLERDGPAPPPPSARRHGFGMRLIEVSARGSLDGDVRLDFTPEGLEVHLQLVLAEVEPVLQVLETDDGVIALPATR